MSLTLSVKVKAFYIHTGNVCLVILYTIISLVNSVPQGGIPNINYSHNMRILKLPANTAVGSLVYRLKGSDPDPDDRLVFGVRGSDAKQLLDVRSVSFREADVYLKSSLNVSTD